VLIAAGPGWTEIVTAVASAVTALGVGAAVVGVFLAKGQVREAKEQVRQTKEQVGESVRGRLAEIAIDMSRRWDEDAMLAARQMLKGMDADAVHQLSEELLNSGDKSKVATYYQLQRIPNLFEDLAVLEKHRCLSIEWIDDTIGGAVIQYWERWRVSVEADRTHQPTLYCNWAALVAQLQERRAALAQRSEQSPTA
jgi:hypothetical protein